MCLLGTVVSRMFTIGYELSVAQTISLCCPMLKIARYGLSTSAAIMSGKFSIWVLVTKSQSTTPRYPNNFVFLAIPVGLLFRREKFTKRVYLFL